MSEIVRREPNGRYAPEGGKMEFVRGTEQGYTTHTCTVCGHEEIDTYVPALGHGIAVEVENYTISLKA